MTEDPKKETGNPPQPSEGDLLARMRDEMSKEFQTLKASFEAQLEELKKQNEKLIADNQGLQAALVRSALADPPKEEPPKEKTPEEIHQEQVDSIAKKTLDIMKRSLTE